MLCEAKAHCKGIANIELAREDFLEHDAAKADLIICYYTVQFVSPRVRQLLFDKIYERLNWGGGFILFEKVRGPDARFQDMASLVYQNFKRQQGFTPDEIMNKAESLKGVLEPFSTQGKSGPHETGGLCRRDVDNEVGVLRRFSRHQMNHHFFALLFPGQTLVMNDSSSPNGAAPTALFLMRRKSRQLTTPGPNGFPTSTVHRIRALPISAIPSRPRCASVSTAVVCSMRGVVSASPAEVFSGPDLTSPVSTYRNVLS